jgi:hypothetical protein
MLGRTTEEREGGTGARSERTSARERDRGSRRVSGEELDEGRWDRPEGGVEWVIYVGFYHGPLGCNFVMGFFVNSVISVNRGSEPN